MNFLKTKSELKAFLILKLNEYIATYNSNLGNSTFRGNLLSTKCTDKILFDSIESYAYEFLPELADNDNDVQFDYENVMIDNFNNANGITGFVELDNVCIFGIYAGGDWEFPVNCVYFSDGINLFIYVPTDGNIFNKTLRSAYGNNNDDLNEDVQYDKNLEISNIQNHLNTFNLIASNSEKSEKVVKKITIKCPCCNKLIEINIDDINDLI